MTRAIDTRRATLAPFALFLRRDRASDGASVHLMGRETKRTPKCAKRRAFAVTTVKSRTKALAAIAARPPVSSCVPQSRSAARPLNEIYTYSICYEGVCGAKTPEAVCHAFRGPTTLAPTRLPGVPSLWAGLRGLLPRERGLSPHGLALRPFRSRPGCRRASPIPPTSRRRGLRPCRRPLPPRAPGSPR